MPSLNAVRLANWVRPSVQRDRPRDHRLGLCIHNDPFVAPAAALAAVSARRSPGYARHLEAHMGAT